MHSCARTRAHLPLSTRFSLVCVCVLQCNCHFNSTIEFRCLHAVLSLVLPFSSSSYSHSLSLLALCFDLFYSYMIFFGIIPWIFASLSCIFVYEYLFIVVIYLIFLLSCHGARSSAIAETGNASKNNNTNA